MPLKNQPCAYCGTVKYKRINGHVISRNLFHEFLSKNVQRITVPECAQCKAAWEDAEAHFRNVFVLAWNPDQLQEDNRLDKMRRSFQKSDGMRRWRDLLNQIVPVNTREAVYPTKDPLCLMILRRIIRGLSHYHNLGTAISESSVEVGSMLWELPPAFEEEMSWYQLAPDFFTYGYCQIDDSEIRSFWQMNFSNHIKLFGIIYQDGAKIKK